MSQDEVAAEALAIDVAAGQTASRRDNRAIGGPARVALDRRAASRRPDGP